MAPIKIRTKRGTIGSPWAKVISKRYPGRKLIAPALMVEEAAKAIIDGMTFCFIKRYTQIDIVRPTKTSLNRLSKVPLRANT